MTMRKAIFITLPVRRVTGYDSVCNIDFKMCLTVDNPFSCAFYLSFHFPCPVFPVYSSYTSQIHLAVTFNMCALLKFCLKRKKLD